MAQTLRMARSGRGAESGRTVLATVLFTDIVGSSELAATLGDRRWHELLSKHHAAVRGELERFDGREIDTAGDGFFASFDTPGLAVHCGLAIIETMDTLGLRIRAGVHVGECERSGDKLGGLAVHIGARIVAEAGAGEILVSGTVKDLLAGSGLRFEDRGSRELRGIPGEWRLYAADRPVPEAEAAPTRIQVCGPIVATVQGRRLDHQLPGRQGRLLFVYLALNRLRPASRDELAHALWPEHAPPGADAGLSSILSKLRRILGPDALVGRHTIQLRLAPDAWIDFDAAAEAMHRAESALARRAWREAWGAARVTLHIAQRGFLPGEDAPWAQERRRRLEELHLRSLEVTADSSLQIGGGELDTAERCARSLVERAPFRESGYRFLMRVLDARGNPAEALRVYERLRILLREEVGTSPSASTQELYRTFLG
jgi:DNA-binding SARP family transcriptional activator/class 3 adenylate cyclase